MESKLHYIAALAYIDNELDELREEFGDLPDQVKEKEDAFNDAKRIVDETNKILDDIKSFVTTAKVTLVELKEKEDSMSKQQFSSRNNKEFDAVTKEIEYLKQEHEKLSTRMRTEGLKEENIKRILDDQVKDMENAKKDYEMMLEEFESISANQDDSVKDLKRARKKIEKDLDEEVYGEYERIRGFHPDAAVQVRRNSCSGCYSAVPSQKIVELRTNTNKVYFCENCGRILVPEEIEMNDTLLESF